MATSLISAGSLDVNTLVSQLMAAERAPLAAMQKTQSAFQSKISAYGQLQNNLSSLSSAVDALNSQLTFSAMAATSSDTSVLSASAGSGAQPGTYSIEVKSLAAAQKLATGSFTDASSIVGTGSINIQFGTFAAGTFTANASKAALNVTIDSSNNTLSGIRDAINAANAGVRASIVNDGSGYRLTLSASDGGTANTLKVSIADGDGTNTDTTGLSQLAYDPAAGAGAGRNLTQSATAKDAQLVIDGVTVTKSSNVITDALPGVTLNLAKTNEGSTITLDVARDASAIQKALEGFVSAYNSFNSLARSLTYYDAANKKAGTLQGDSAVKSLQAQVKAGIIGGVPGLTSGLTNLAQVGLSLQTDGSLKLDASKLKSALADPASNLTALFNDAGRSTDSRIAFVGASSGVATGDYAFSVTRAASSGTLAGAAAAGLTISAGVNDALSLSVDGVATSVTLSPGTYASADALSAELQSKINGSAALKNVGLSVKVSQSAGALSITSTSFGAGSSVSAVSSNAATGLLGASPVATAGLDAAGTINGVAATGSGQILSTAGGLRLSASGATSGYSGTLSFTRGHASMLKAAMTTLTDATNGPIAARLAGLNSSLKSNQTQQDAFNARMDALQATYTRQFSGLNSMLTSMSQTQTYLSQMLASNNSN